MADERRVVWVLGAGFSKPLGGPMLADLLSLESRRDLLPRHPISDDPGVYWLYHYGRKFPDGFINQGGERTDVKGGENLWEHAEDYLDKLDTAARTPNGALAERLIRVLKDGPKGFAPPPEGVYQKLANENWKRLRFIADKARQYVAAECINFMCKTTEKAEQWGPYRRWARALTGADVIITFNYDTVIERAQSVRAEGELPGIVSVLSDDDWKRAGETQSPCLLKLHGSVNWRWDEESKSIQLMDDEYFAESADLDQLVIATPGLSKQDAVQRQLGVQWRWAKHALQSATAVVFIGYRFPPTDAEARREILGAIGQNRDPSLVDVHTVLGPRDDEHTARLVALLHVACQEGRKSPLAPGPARDYYRVTRHPLFGEDFLSLWQRARLFDPRPGA